MMGDATDEVTFYPDEPPRTMQDEYERPIKRYVVGFLFAGGSWTLLLRKKRPEWQAGKLNGPGGKVEPGETFHQAMCREFEEEVGYEGITVWEHFATLKVYSPAVAEIAFFRVKVPAHHRSLIDEAIQLRRGDEKPEWVVTSSLPDDVIPNLRFLIPMAFHGKRDEWPYTIFEAPNQHREPIADATGTP